MKTKFRNLTIVTTDLTKQFLLPPQPTAEQLKNSEILMAVDNVEMVTPQSNTNEDADKVTDVIAPKEAEKADATSELDDAVELALTIGLYGSRNKRKTTIGLTTTQTTFDIDALETLNSFLPRVGVK